MDTKNTAKKEYVTPSLISQGSVTDRTLGHTGFQGYDTGSTTGATYLKPTDDE